MCTENIPWRSILNKQVQNCTPFAVPTISARVLVFTANDSAHLAIPWVKMVGKKKPHFFVFLLFYPHLSKTSKFWLLILPWFVSSLLLECHRNNFGPGFLFISINKISLLDLPCFAVAPREYSLLWNRCHQASLWWWSPPFRPLAFHHHIRITSVTAKMPFPLDPADFSFLSSQFASFYWRNCSHFLHSHMLSCFVALCIGWSPGVTSSSFSTCSYSSFKNNSSNSSVSHRKPLVKPARAKRLLSVVPEQGMPTIYL